MRIQVHHTIEMSAEVYARFKAMSHKLDLIFSRLENAIMATKQEVLADLAEMRTEVTETRGAADSAVLYIKELLDRIGTAAATAADLDEFRAELALIKQGNQATEDALKTAIVQNPT